MFCSAGDATNPTFKVVTFDRDFPQDTILPLRLVSKLKVLTLLFQMANATCCDISWVCFRGQQIRCFSKILQKA